MNRFTSSPGIDAAGGLLLAAVVAVALLACSPAEPDGSSGSGSPGAIADRGDGSPGSAADALAALSERDDLNVLFILIDTLRAHRLGAYGYERETSPNLDRLAAAGIRFSRHVAQSSWTKCSMASLWTGLYPVRTGVTRYDDALPEGARMPAEIFREAGFRTAALWRNGWVAPNFGFGQGFELYVRPRPLPVPIEVRRNNPSIRLDGSDQDIAVSAFEFLRQHADDRWFLYLHMMDAHQYASDDISARFGTSHSDIYDNSVHFVDRMIGRLLVELGRLGLRERTLVVVSSDHGEAFGEHGLEGHARDLFGEVTEVPFIVSPPFRIEPGIVIRTPSANVDVWPTLLDLLGLPPLDDPDGRSYLPDILYAATGQGAPGEVQPKFAYIDQTWGKTEKEPSPLLAATHDGFRLFRASRGKGSVLLFDLAADPLEQKNVAALHPEIVERLNGELDALLERPPAPWGEASEVELDEMMLNQLRALGYKVE